MNYDKSKLPVIYILLILYFWMIATVIRYPTSIEITLLSLDPNFPLHALAAQDLSDGGTPFFNTSLEWPNGAPIRYLAWPLLLIGTVLNQFLEPIPAMNLSIVAWFALQGFGMSIVFQSLLQQWSRAILASTLALISPQVLIASGNAQFENIVPFFFVLIAWAAFRKKSLWLLIGILSTCFSSPYMGFLGILLAIFLGFRNKWTWINSAVSSVLVSVYYRAVIIGSVHDSTQPNPTGMNESAELLGLISPIITTESGKKQLPDPIDRIQSILEPSTSAMLDDNWMSIMTTSSSYLGVVWCFLGLVGLWNKRKDPFVLGLCLWMLVAVILSFGDSLVIAFPVNTSDGLQISNISIPWIWSFTDFVPGISDVNATQRFLMAPSLLLALGVVCIGNRGLLILGSILCIGEAFLLTPAHWTIPAKKIHIPEELGEINDPFIFWAPTTNMSTYQVTLMRLTVDQPVATFLEQNLKMSLGDEAEATYGNRTNRQGQTLSEWTDQMVGMNVNRLIQYRSVQESAQSAPFKTHRNMCYTSYCLSLLVHELD